MSLFTNTKTKGKSCVKFNIWPKYIVRRAYASFKISDLRIAFGLNGLPVILKIFPLSTPILPLLWTRRRGQAISIDWHCPISSQIPRFPFVLRTNVYLFWGQMRICLEDKCVLALLQSNPTFRRRFTAIWRMPWQMGSSQPLSLQYVLSPKQRKLRHIKAGCLREISELANYMMEGTVGTGQNLLVLESSFLAPNPVYK